MFLMPPLMQFNDCIEASTLNPSSQAPARPHSRHIFNIKVSYFDVNLCIILSGLSLEIPTPHCDWPAATIVVMGERAASFL